MKDTDGGTLDKLATAGRQRRRASTGSKNYSESFDGHVHRPSRICVSYDSDDPSSPTVCGGETYEQSERASSARARTSWPGTAACWSPSASSSSATRRSPPCSPTSTATPSRTWRSIADDDTPTIVSEQQADCFAGTYIRWVAEGQSPRFRAEHRRRPQSRSGGGDYAARPRSYARRRRDMLEQGHGTALDRISAFQMGFARAPQDCAKIDMDEITAAARRPSADAAARPEQRRRATRRRRRSTEGTLTDADGRARARSSSRRSLRSCRSNTEDAPTRSRARRRPTARPRNTIFVDLSALEEIGQAADARTTC